MSSPFEIGYKEGIRLDLPNGLYPGEEDACLDGLATGVLANTQLRGPVIDTLVGENGIKSEDEAHKIALAGLIATRDQFPANGEQLGTLRKIIGELISDYNASLV